MSAHLGSCVAIFVTVLAAACARPTDDHPASAATQFLVDRLDTATVRFVPDQASSPVGELETDERGDVWLRAELAATGGWEPVTEKRARRFGMEDEGLRAWFLPVALPTDLADEVGLELGSHPLAHWERSQPPGSWAGFYSPGGYVREGIYVALPRDVLPGALRLGLRLRPSTPALLAHRVAEQSPFPPTALARHATVDVATRPSLFLPAGVELAFPVDPPEHGRLRFGLARVDGPWSSPGARGFLHVTWRSAPGRAARGLEETAAEAPIVDERFPLAEVTSSEWRDHRIDLAAVAGQSGELVFEVVDASESPPLYFVGDPIVETSEPPSRPNLIAIAIDGLRADRLTPRPGGELLTPTLRRLAESGLELSEARAPAPWTRPSISSLFTGVPPARHGVERERASDALPADLPTLAEALRGAGYATRAVSANLHLHPAFGLQRGFGEISIAIEDGARVNERALEWLDRRPAGPFFLFLFYMDTHYPFDARPQYDRSSHIEAEAPNRHQMTTPEVRAKTGIPDPTPDQVKLLEALYDENVIYTDALIGELLAALEARGLLENTLVIVTADHGEAFGEHGTFFHGWNLYEELLHVPLIAAGGPLEARGVRSDSVSLVDLPASLLALLDVPATGLPGRTDLFRKERESAPQEPVVAETRFRGMHAATIVESPYKLIWDRQTGASQLFDLRDDPGERDDRREDQAERARALESKLRERLAESAQERTRNAATVPSARLSPESVEQLRALGYLPDESD